MALSEWDKKNLTGGQQRELERIAAEMKPIAESVSFDPFRLVEAIV